MVLSHHRDMAMDSIETAFTALSRRMGVPAPMLPLFPPHRPESLSSLIDKVNAAKRAYEPGLRR